jgi:GNAT superfamily N-acetyltransferase
MSVRDAGPGDNQALIGLAARCPMHADLSLCIERRPDFFALNRLGGTRWRVGVADGEHGPIGCIGVAKRAVYLAGRETHIGYVGDLKVDPEHRRRGAGKELLKWAEDAARELTGPDAPLMCTVLSGNDAVGTLRGSYPAARRWATIRSHSISLLWRRRPPASGLSVRLAGAADVPGMMGLWVRQAMSRRLAPVLESIPLAVEGLDYLVAHHDDGTIAGFAGLWDQHRVKQMRVTGYSPRMAVVRTAFNLAAPLFGAPGLPPPGGAMRYRTVVNLCADSPQTLRTLLLQACERLRGEYSFLTVGLDTRDPLSRALHGLQAQPTDVDLLVLGGPDSDGCPVHFEIATV